MKHVLIGVAGPPTSGKTMLCKCLAELRDDVTVVKLDNFFKDFFEFPVYNGWKTWDDPVNLKWDKLYSVMTALKRGESVTCPVYSKTSGKSTGDVTIYPERIILIEGFLLFYEREIREMLDMKVFLDITEDAQRERSKERILRAGLNSKGQDYFTQVAVPLRRMYCMPTKEYADHVIDANRPFDEVKAEFLKILEPYL